MPEKMFSGIKSVFFEFSSTPDDFVLFWKRHFCDVKSLKVEKPKTSNFAYLLVSSVPLFEQNFKLIR